VLLMGGTDVNPSRYGESAQPETDAPDNERDEAEFGVMGQAMGANVPVLAICRGLQLLNVYCGGTLVQHLPSAAKHDVEAADYSEAAHGVNIEAETLLARIAGTTHWRVNSRHHQAVAKIGTGLRLSARAEDGTVEALEDPGKRFVVGVQWHPEDQAPRDGEQRKLFESFAEACAGRL
jgi:gamma-glutamyl-gamma-aminobutyrate hydrolase PuuD